MKRANTLSIALLTHLCLAGGGSAAAEPAKAPDGRTSLRQAATVAAPPLSTAEVRGALRTLPPPDRLPPEAAALGPIPAAGVSFSTTDDFLLRLYRAAEATCRGNVVRFPPPLDLDILIEGSGYSGAFLETQPMAGLMWGKRDLRIARNNQMIFMLNQASDGQLPLRVNPEYRHYGGLSGYCFPTPAWELYFLLNKDREYLQRLYVALEGHDRFLYATRDVNRNGHLVALSRLDTGEDGGSRWPSSQPDGRFFYESMDVMSYAYDGQKTLALVAAELGNGQAAFWQAKADATRRTMISRLWRPERHACYDRGPDGEFSGILLHNNLRCMYHGSFTQDMADAFIRHHLLNPDAFWTPMPLVSIAANDPSFKSITHNNWSGQPQGLTFQRAIRALGNYGHYAEVTLIGRKLLAAVGEELVFTQQFDPWTGQPNVPNRLRTSTYGPTALAVLEYIAHLHGVELVPHRDQVWFSGLARGEHEHEYTQQWNGRTFTLRMKDGQFEGLVDGKQAFTCSANVRVVTDWNGRVTHVVGISPKPERVTIKVGTEKHALAVSPNQVFTLDGAGAFAPGPSAPFDYPHPNSVAPPRLAAPIADASPVQWLEAENYESQRGSASGKFTMPPSSGGVCIKRETPVCPHCSATSAASGGACVPYDWGAKRGDFLRYKVELESDFVELHVTLRYAREAEGEAHLSVALVGDAASTRNLKLPSTGNWGSKPEGWRYAAVQLPAAAKGTRRLEIRSQVDGGNVSLDGIYLSARPLETGRPIAEPPSGTELIAALGEGLFPLPCRTPIALPYSRLKAYVTGGGLIQSLLSTPKLQRGGNIPGPSLQVKLAGHGPWQAVEQRMILAPVPMVETRFRWPDVEMEQTVFAAAPEEEGFFVRVTVTNKAPEGREFELASLLRKAGVARFAGDARFVAQGKPLLRVDQPAATHLITYSPSIPGPQSVRHQTFPSPSTSPANPGPLGGGPQLRHRIAVPAHGSVSFDLQFLGAGVSRDDAFAATGAFWRQKLAPTQPLRLPDPKLQYAYDASLRQMLMLIEARPNHARVLKGLEHYYGSNPYDTFQVSRALDAAGLKEDARELLRHQISHLKDDGIFEMWETGDLKKAGADQWIVQGLAATALWNHYERWREDDWLREIAPTLIKAAQATLRIRQSHAGVHRQGAVEVADYADPSRRAYTPTGVNQQVAVAVEGWLPPIGGDGGLGRGYHWSQNAGALHGVRLAAEAVRRLERPEAAELRAGYLDFQRAFDQVRLQVTQSDPDRMLPSFPGAAGDQRLRPLWGLVMSVSAFDAIPSDDPAAINTLRFIQQNRHGGLHLNLGYSKGVWPYLSAEVALWHLRLGETDEGWRILRAIVDRASSTGCWYEEIGYAPPIGYRDPADVWAAAEIVHLVHQLEISEGKTPLKPGGTLQR
jgi:hypothetical protein